MYLFREVEDAPPLLDTPARPAAKAREEFLGALREAESFAKQAGSPFFEAFKLARFALEDGALRLMGNLSSPEGVAALQVVLKTAGFSEQAGEVFERKAGAVSEFELFHASEEKLRGVLACTVADVFGGMGSWNDQPVGTPEAQEQYEQISRRLFRALRAFIETTLNME
jgi:hypothetical protein